MSDSGPTAPRPVSESNQYVWFEEFKHAGLTVALGVVGHDFSPRYCDCTPEGVVVCAGPYYGLTDVGGDGRPVLADDAALALLLAGPLTERSVMALEAHLRAEHEATVLLPLYVNEADAGALTGVSLSAELGDGVLAGVIFACEDGEDDGSRDGSAGANGPPEHLLLAVAQYRSYLRGEILLATVRDVDDDDVDWWSDMEYEGDLDELRATAKRAAKTMRRRLSSGKAPNW